MKKLLVTMAVAIVGAVQAFALTSMEIRENARFLTDRMAYELHLTPQQIEDCYEINYDFICSINPLMDEVVYGYPEYIDRYYNYLDYRNDDLRYIMNEAQYMTFITLDYFFRPIYTYAGNWMFRIFDIYTNHRFFYYDPPVIYHSYYGGHGRNYFPHGYYGGGRYHHHVYAHPHPIYRGGGHRDFGPHAARPRQYYAPRHTPSTTRHERMNHGGNDNHHSDNHGINQRGGGNDNQRGNDHGINQRGGGNNDQRGGANQGGSNGRGNDHGNRGGGANQGSNSNRASQAQPSNSGRQMHQQASGRSERVQGNVMHGASGTTRAASSSRSDSSQRGGSASHSSGSHGGGSRGGSNGGSSHDGGHQRR